MARLPASGGTMLLSRSPSDLSAIIEALNAEFKLNMVCEDEELEDLWWALGRVKGRFVGETMRVTTKAVRARLTKLSSACADILEILAIERGGLIKQPPAVVAAFSQLRQTLAL